METNQAHYTSVGAHVLPDRAVKDAPLIKTSLLSLPPEIIIVIMQTTIGRWDHCTAICLGLSHPSFYLSLKRLYPQPIPLSHRTCLITAQDEYSQDSENLSIRMIYLDRLLRDLFPAQYRLAKSFTKGDSIYFLRKEAYGEKFGYREWRLRERYEDYELMTFRYKKKLYHLLENPYNQGDQWYAGVYKMLEQTEFPGWSPAVKKFWDDRVEKTHLIWRGPKGVPALLASFEQGSCSNFHVVQS